jgi:hypothetical protein
MATVEEYYFSVTVHYQQTQKNQVVDLQNQTLALRWSTPLIFNPAEDCFK